MRTLFLAVIFLFSDLNAEEIRLTCKYNESKTYSTLEPDKPTINKKDKTWEFDLLIDKSNKNFAKHPVNLLSDCGNLNGQRKLKIEPNEFILEFNCPSSKLSGNLSSIDELQNYYNAAQQIGEALRNEKYNDSIYLDILTNNNIKSSQRFKSWLTLYADYVKDIQSRNEKFKLPMFTSASMVMKSTITVNRTSGRIIDVFETPEIRTRIVGIGFCEKINTKKKF